MRKVTHDEAAERLKWVKAQKAHFNTLRPPRRVTPVQLFRRLKECFPNAQPSWSRRDDRPYMLSRFHDDLRDLKRAEFGVGVRPNRAVAATESGQSKSDYSSVRASHSRELGEYLIQRPDALLEKDLSLGDADSDLVSYAQDHLGAYPELRMARSELQTAEERLAKLQGPPHPFRHLYGSGILIAGEAGDLLLRKVRAVLARLYPGIPEQPDSGSMLPVCILPKEAALEIWMEVGAWEGVGGHMDFEVVLEPFEGRWRVCRPHSTAYAIVRKQENGKVVGLKQGLRRLGSDPDLRKMYRLVRGATEHSIKARAAYIENVRRLGRQLRLGVQLRGSCALCSGL